MCVLPDILGNSEKRISLLYQNASFNIIFPLVWSDTFKYQTTDWNLFEKSQQASVKIAKDRADRTKNIGTASVPWLICD